MGFNKKRETFVPHILRKCIGRVRDLENIMTIIARFKVFYSIKFGSDTKSG